MFAGAFESFSANWALPRVAGELTVEMPSSGSLDVTVNDLTLRAEPVPNQPGIFFFGPNQIQTPFCDGFLCVGAPINRIYPPRLAADNISLSPAAANGISNLLIGVGVGGLVVCAVGGFVYWLIAGRTAGRWLELRWFEQNRR